MPCNRSTSKCDYETALPQCCSNHIKELVIYTTNLLTQLKVIHWIDFAALRSCYTSEVEQSDNAICYTEEDFSKIGSLKNRVFEDGYYLTAQKVANINWFRMYYSKKNLVYIDLIDGYFEDDTYFNKPIYSDYNNSALLENLTMLERIKYFGHEVYCPNNAKDYYNKRVKNV